jgi:hypothetical protein
MKGLDSAFSIETRMHSFNALPLGASMPVASLWLFSIEPPGRGVLSLLGGPHPNRTGRYLPAVLRTFHTRP